MAECRAQAIWAPFNDVVVIDLTSPYAWSATSIAKITAETIDATRAGGNECRKTSFAHARRFMVTGCRLSITIAAITRISVISYQPTDGAGDG